MTLFLGLGLDGVLVGDFAHQHEADGAGDHDHGRDDGDAGGNQSADDHALPASIHGRDLIDIEVEPEVPARQLVHAVEPADVLVGHNKRFYEGRLSFGCMHDFPSAGGLVARDSSLRRKVRIASRFPQPLNLVKFPYPAGDGEFSVNGMGA